MLNKKLAVVDPDLSHQSVVKRFIDSGIDVVVLCEEGDVTSLGAQVETRGFNFGDCDVGDACCVLEFVPDSSSKTAFYNGSSVKNGRMLLLSYGLTNAQYRELCNAVPGDVSRRIAGFLSPSFCQYRQILECVLHSQDVGPCFGLVQEYLSGVVSMIRTTANNNLVDRLGYFWAGTCVIEAMRSGVVVEVADRLLTNENTGVHLGAFAALDALGLDKFVEGLDLLSGTLEHDDLLRQVQENLPSIIHGMIADGLIGAGSRGGFYRTYEMSSGAVEQVIDLNSGLYRALKKDQYLQESLQDEEKCRAFSTEVWRLFFTYVGHIVKEQGQGVIKELDEVLRVGYNWQYCVEELASRVGIRNFF